MRLSGDGEGSDYNCLAPAAISLATDRAGGERFVAHLRTKAIVAVAHTILVISYDVLNRRELYRASAPVIR